MKINIQARGFELTDSLRDQTERRLRYALSWADDHLRQVSVHLSSESGPRRDKNLRCRIQIDFPRAHDIVIEDTETDWSVAIDRAADRVSRSVALLLERQRDHRHGSLPPAIPGHVSGPTPKINSLEKVG
ncbi:MAG: HPF/RaiA family ribosome-associated protein [Candidatus Competibacter sp.]|nr:HPF/RaiA family ribosome-associated protein [Candidatus Competibacter sp.]